MHGKKLGEVRTGAPVYDRKKSHIHTEYDRIFEFIEKVLPRITPPEHEIIFYHSEDFGEIIGESICVSTTKEDEIVYARRKNRNGLTRFVKNRSPRPTLVFTVVLKRDQYSETEQYILVTAYVGEKAPVEPWDTHADEYSRQFWSTHALVWGSVPIVSDTETTSI